MKSIKFVPELTEQQIVNLKTLENGDWPGRVRKRAEAILLSGRGYTIDEIGAITGFHRNTVSRWLDQWAERGIDGILEREGRGRKHSLSEDEERQVMEWVEENPRSANQAVGRIEQALGKIVSPDTVRRLLKRKGKVWSGCAPAWQSAATRRNSANANKSLPNTSRRPPPAKSTCTTWTKAALGAPLTYLTDGRTRGRAWPCPAATGRGSTCWGCTR